MATQRKSGKTTPVAKDTEAAQPVEEQPKAEVKKAPAKKKATSTKTKTTKAASDSKKEAKATKTTKAKTSKKAEAAQTTTSTRAPQMITPNGGKVTHAHFFQSTFDASKWYMSAKIDGVQLHVKEVTPEDLARVTQLIENNEKFPVEEMMAKYYPSKIATKVSDAQFTLPCEIKGVNGKTHTVERLNPYKEKTIGNADFGKWKLFTRIDGKNMSVAPSSELMSAYFDRTMPIDKIVAQAFGVQLHLPAAYEQYKKPDGIEAGMARVHKVSGDDKRWFVSVKLGEGLSTPAKPISYDDSGSYFAKAVTADQLAGKYLQKEVASLLEKASQQQDVKETQSKSQKL